MIHISLASETLFHIGPLPVTNSLLMAWLAIVVVCIVVYFGTRRKDEVPRGFQNFFEMLIEGLLKLVEGVTENRKQAVQFLPLIGTFLIFITLSNWMGLLPGVGTIGVYETEHVAEASTEQTATEHNATDNALPASENTESVHEAASETTSATAESKAEKVFVPLFRSTYSDMNMTLALALISIVMTQFFGIAALGFFKYTKKFLNFSGVIPFFVGILELVGEVAHLISFSFRLFGNVFAGEVLLTVMAAMVAYIAPVPFYFLEIFVGFIQALVFGLLTLVFIKTATASHEAH